VETLCEVQVPSKSPETYILPYPAVTATLVHYYFAQATGAAMKEKKSYDEEYIEQWAAKSEALI